MTGEHGRREEDSPQHPQSSPDVNSINLTVMRHFLAVKGWARFILIPAVAVMGILSQFYTQGMPALLAGATAWTSLRNQELTAKASEQAGEIELLKLQVDLVKASIPPPSDSAEQKKQERLDKRIRQLNEAIGNLKPKENN